jgi:hypothetical protein
MITAGKFHQYCPLVDLVPRFPPNTPPITGPERYVANSHLPLSPWKAYLAVISEFYDYRKRAAPK